jgi:hypothetical protein
MKDLVLVDNLEKEGNDDLILVHIWWSGVAWGGNLHVLICLAFQFNGLKWHQNYSSALSCRYDHGKNEVATTSLDVLSNDYILSPVHS